MIGGVAVGAVVLLGILTILALPKYVEFRLDGAAQTAGIDAKWSKVSFAASAITLQDVTLHIADVPGLVLTAKQVELTPAYAPSHAAIRGGTLSLAGPAADQEQHLQAWASAHPSTIDMTNATLDDIHVEWPRVFGDTHVLRSDGLHAEITHLSATNKLVASTPSLRLDGDHGSLGPWGVDVTADNAGTTMHAALDPSVPQEAAISLSFPNDAPPSITAHVSRTPLSHLGVSPSLLGLAPTDDTQLEVEAQLAGSAPSRMRGDVHLTLHDARTTAMPVPLDIVLVASVNGDTTQPLPIHVTQLMIGPLRAQAETLLDVSNGGFRVDGKWSAQMPCARMADVASDAGFGLGTVSTPLGKLAKTAERAGEAQASGIVTFDAQNLDRIRFAPTYSATCGIPLLTALAAP